MIILFIFICSCLSLPITATAIATSTSTTNIYVALPGTIKHQLKELGTLEQPFSSLEAARDHLRTGYANTTTRIISLADGHYALKHPFFLDERDSGSKAYPIRYQSLHNNSTLFGGVEIPKSAFEQSSISNVFVANLYQCCNITKSSLGSLSNPYPKAKMELFYGSKPMTLARDPNIGDDILRTWQWVGYENMTSIANSTTTFDFADHVTAKKWMESMSNDAARNDTGNFWLHGYWKFDWRDTFVSVSNIQPVSVQNSSLYQVTIDKDTPTQYPWTNGCRFYAVNSLGLLDSPGEYYISPSTGELYFWPPTGSNITLPVFVSVLSQVISVSNAKHLSFDNLTISTSQKTVIDVTSSENINVTQSTISNAGDACIGMSDVTNSHVLNNVVYGCGGSGISIQSGSIQSLEHGNSSVVNNDIANFSRIRRTYQPGIEFNSVGLYVAFNNISHCPHAGIQGGGNDNVFEFNRINHCTYETVDVGAFYIGRSWSQRGNIARHNTFETIRSTERLAQASCSQNAFYLDDQMSGWTFESNTIINASTGVLIGGGRRNKIINNIFINCDGDIHFDNRGMNWQANTCNQSCDPNLGTSCFHGELVKLHYQDPPYSVQYPEIVNIFQDYPCVPIKNIIQGNRYCHKKSRGGGKFIDRNLSTIQNSWLSSMSNNSETC